MIKTKRNIIKFITKISLKLGIKANNLIWLIRLFVLIMFMPLIFSLKMFPILGFDASTGVIGDTIGGITAPFINFFAAVLVYLALKEQIKANKLIGDQFLDEKKEKFEKVIYEEVLTEINSVILNFEKFDGHSLIKEAYEQFPSKEEILQKIYLGAIHEETKKISNDSETTLFLQYFNKLIDILELFNSNVQNEKAYIKIIELRIEKIYTLLKSTPLFEHRTNANEIFEKSFSNFLRLTKATQLELLIRLFKVENLIYSKIGETDKVRTTNQILEWYEPNLKNLKRKLEFKKKYDQIFFKEFGIQMAKNKDVGYELYSPNKYTDQDNSLKKEREFLKTEVQNFIQELEGQRIKHSNLNNLIEGL